MLTRHRGPHIQVQTYRGVPTSGDRGLRLRSLYVLKNVKILLSH
jgi:hypothetical protein